MIHLTGDTYEGNYKDNNRHGFGEFTWLNGDNYKGEWQNDKINGAGIKRSANGAILQQGNWKDDVFLEK